jgi:hypothetical protein
MQPESEEGVGCRPAAVGTLTFLAFAVAMLVIALVIGLDEQLAYPFLFAGGPVTGLVTSVGGDLAFSWPLDLTVWTVLPVMPIGRRDIVSSLAG